ncbi:hypothetical protein Bca52824_055036 [Brassica carinata]|uniref:chorismate mutase n=1 Tax=Brassica carinata TaxID=52824 RepID=A0A8X7UN96_BRACI|nr:hypothetical protein Bca52824_055036 [Brassica carinata]
MVWFAYCDDEPDSFISFDPVFTDTQHNVTNPNFVFDFVLVYRRAPEPDSDSDDVLEDLCYLETQVFSETLEFDREWLIGGGDRDQIKSNVFHILEMIQVPSYSDIVHTLTIDILDLKKHVSVSDSPEIERIRVEIDTIVPRSLTGKKRVDESESLTIEGIRDSLIRHEDSIIFGLLERANYCYNADTYDPNAFNMEGCSKAPRSFTLRYIIRALMNILSSQTICLSLCFLLCSTLRNQNPRPHVEQERSRYEANLQWCPRAEPSIQRSKEPPQLNAKIRVDEARSSPMVQSPLARGVPLRSDLPLNTQAALEEALGEVREVMNQYTMCVDPTESAACKERLRQAEEQGQLEETAHMMVKASMQAQAPLAPEEPSPTSTERV